MARAELGDDGYGEDPTVSRLEDHFAEMVGKDAALFVASGTMGNLVSLLVAGRSGSPVFADARSHLLVAERASVERLARMRAIPVNVDGGIDDPSALDSAMRAHTRGPGSVMSIENTQVLHAGQCLDEEYTKAVVSTAIAHGVWVHLDGARLFNASVRLDVPVASLASPVNSLTICLSKGLSCPAGALVAGSTRFVDEARFVRRMLGGTMRQVGVLAAAGIFALVERFEDTRENLAIDHTMAASFADRLSEFSEVRVLRSKLPATNMVVFRLSDSLSRVGNPRDAFILACERYGVKFGPYPDGSIRAVTHRGIGTEQVQSAIRTVGKALHDLR